MRSRYTAFALEDAAYLTNWHRSTRPSRIDFTPDQEWILLRIIAADEIEDTATVEFVARSRIGGRIHELHEVSRFIREQGRWFYVDGVSQ